MIKITFPDNSVREYAKGTTAMQIAESISSRLAQEVLAASVNGEVWDLSRPINDDATVKLLKWEDEEGKHGDFVILNSDNYHILPYYIGMNCVIMTIKGGILYPVA